MTRLARTGWGILAPILAALLIGAAMAQVLPVQPAQYVATREEGAAVAERVCSACHVVGDAGTDAAPSFAAIARNRSPDWVRGFLAHPHTTMPPLSLTTREIEDIVAYLTSLQ